MKNIFIAFIFIVCSVVAVNVFAQDIPEPTCETFDPDKSCTLPSQIPAARAGCATGPVGGYFTEEGELHCGMAYGIQMIAVSCGRSCSCPEGFSFYENVDQDGNFVSGCAPEDTGGEPEEPQECPEGHVANPLALVAGSCTPIVADPSDCSGTGISQGQVVDIGGSLTCAAEDRPCQSAGGEIGSVFLPGGASLPSCTFGGGGSGSSSSSGDGDGDEDGGSGSSSSSGEGDGDDSGSSSSSGSGDGDGSGGSSSSGSGGGGGSGSGDCDPTSKEYAECVGYTEEVDDGLADQIVGDATGEAEDKLNEAYDEIVDDIENFSGIDSEFSDSPTALSSALQSFLPAPVGCSNIPITFMGQTSSLDCNLFNDFKLAFGWFLSILTAVYIWSLAAKPVQR